LTGTTSNPEARSLRYIALAACRESRETPATAKRFPERNWATLEGILAIDPDTSLASVAPSTTHGNRHNPPQPATLRNLSACPLDQPVNTGRYRYG
jgi:hypothetical protein